MVLHSGDSHSWNNSLAHATFDDNVDRVGRDTALQFLREDIRSWIRERKGQSSQWSLYVRDGQMVTQTGVSLEGMTDNITNGPHSYLVPEDIKATAHLEAATLDEATRLAVAGADRIVLPEQHLDVQGNIVSRYLSVWTKNASDPSRYDGSRIDLGKNIRIEDVRTGVSFTAFGLNEDITFHQHGEQKQAFVLEIKNDGTKPFEVVEKAIITTIHRSHQETYSHDLRGDTSLKDERQVRLEAKQERYEVFDKIKNLDAPTPQRVHDTDLFIHVPRAVVRETVDTVRGVAVFLRDKEKRKEGIDRIRRVFSGEKKSIDNNNAAALMLSINQKSEEGALHPIVQPERLTIEKIREKPVRAAKEIEKRHGEMRQNVAMLVVAAETKVALGAAPVLLAILAKEQPKSIRAVEKSKKRHRKKELRIKNKELGKKVKRERKNLQKVQPLKPERVEPLRARKERKKKKIRADASREVKTGNRKEQGRRVKRAKEIGVKRVAAASEIILSASKKRERREKRKMRKAVEKSMRRHKKKELRMENKVQPLIEKKRSIQRKEREAVGEMVFGWMVWMILARKDSETPKSNLKMSHPALHGETLRRQEETLWILLSIIYYLTAIREQGMVNTTNTTNTTNNSMKKRKILLPQYAVIFAYNS